MSLINRPAIVDALQRTGDLEIDTITSENGKEFAELHYVANILHLGWFFADPYSTNQKVCIENVNALI
jgi:IS30 family transposase